MDKLFLPGPSTPSDPGTARTKGASSPQSSQEPNGQNALTLPLNTGLHHISDIGLAKMHMRARALAEARWENSSHMDPAVANNYSWSKRVLARFKLGILEHEKRQLRQARNRKRKARVVDNSDESEDDDFGQLCRRTESQKLTWLELDKAEDFKFVTQDNVKRRLFQPQDTTVPESPLILLKKGKRKKKGWRRRTSETSKQRLWNTNGTTEETTKIESLKMALHCIT